MYYRLPYASAAAEEALRKLGDKESMAGIPGVERAPSVGHVLNEMFEATVETKLRQPTFVLDHPTEISPLAKPHRSKPGVTVGWCKMSFVCLTRELERRTVSNSQRS